jgi:hypothetical protein
MGIRRHAFLLSRLTGRKKVQPVTPRNDYLEITNVIQNTIQTAITPLITKINAIDEKVNELRQDRVTRTEFSAAIDNLRKEMFGSFVSKEPYETRHATLINRDNQLELLMRDMRKDYEEELKGFRAQYQQDKDHIHARLESGKQQFEDRMKEIEEMIDKKFDTQQKAVLSARDQFWVRASLFSGFIATLIVLIEFLLAHVHLN